MKDNQLLVMLQDLDKKGEFDQLNDLLKQYESDAKLSPVVSYYRGYMLQFGRGVKENYDEAITLYEKSYRDGKYPLAAYRLSKAYETGYFRNIDIKKANALLKEAADKEVDEATNDLAVCYISGREDIRQNIPQAIALWKKCIKNNYPLGAINYAYYLLTNSDNKNEAKESLNTLKKYAEENNKDAMYYYGLVLINGTKTNKNLVAGFNYMKKSASLGYLKAILFLADCLYNGHFVAVDHKAAMYYFEKAALLGDVEACLQASYGYLKGDGVVKNLQKSLDYCYMAAKAGNADAQIALGDRYYYGDSVKQDFHIALHWYKEASELNNAYAYERMADMLVDGQGIKKDSKLAFEFYNKALELGDKDVYLALGTMYEKGIGTKRNKELALQNYLLGYKKNNPYAAFKYAELASSGKINGIKDYQNAAPAYVLAASADIVEANKKAGECYLKGLGVVRDLEKSLDFYLKASLLGDTESAIMVNIIKKQIDLNSI